jgi:CheY-like chemotaxis protein
MEIRTASAVTGRPPGDSEYISLQLCDGGCGSDPGKPEGAFSAPGPGRGIGQGANLIWKPAMVQAVQRGAAAVRFAEDEEILHIFLAQTGGERNCERNKPERGIDTGHPGTILLVDDDQIIIELLGIMLAKLGFTVLSAGDGLGAMDMFHEHQEDIRLVMTDVYMPRMNGWDTLEAVRQLAPDMPVILFSGCSEEQVMKELHSEIPQAFLKKPFGFELLRDTIQRIIKDTV